MRKHEREIAQLAKEFGRAIVKTKSGHYKLVKPGFPMVVTSGSPSDHRTLKNLRAELRRAEEGR